MTLVRTYTAIQDNTAQANIQTNIQERKFVCAIVPVNILDCRNYIEKLLT